MPSCRPLVLVKAKKKAEPRQNQSIAPFRDLFLFEATNRFPQPLAPPSMPDSAEVGTGRRLYSCACTQEAPLHVCVCVCVRVQRKGEAGPVRPAFTLLAWACSARGSTGQGSAAVRCLCELTETYAGQGMPAAQAAAAA
jgi:hypothetical protein